MGKLYRSLILIILLMAAPLLHAQNFEWVANYGGSLNDYGHSICVDAAGNVYTVGYFAGTSDFDPDTGTYNLTAVANLDVFIQKLDASSKLLWARSFGGSSSDFGLDICVDQRGNVYTTGY
ncbi:MAG: SBBP repeat-containing protein [Flavobacteriales bacterium]|nr:SBBP repeat-containing protein [Flavobacteriales bacterium]